MKCFFALSGGNSHYHQMARVLVRSALRHTDLALHCVYDAGASASRRWLEAAGVTVLPWQVSFLDELERDYGGEMPLEFLRGTYLCMELPRVLEDYGIADEHVLYVDVDTLFTGPVELENCRPRYFAASCDWKLDDWSRFGTGVMVMNRKALIERYPAFVSHLRRHRFDFAFAGMGPCDQGAWNTFYVGGEMEKLPPLYDWKPWWGINPQARIVHFSGPKPQDVLRLLALEKAQNQRDHLHRMVVRENPDAYRYYAGLWADYLKELPT